MWQPRGIRPETDHLPRSSVGQWFPIANENVSRFPVRLAAGFLVFVPFVQPTRCNETFVRPQHCFADPGSDGTRFEFLEQFCPVSLPLITRVHPEMSQLTGGAFVVLEATDSHDRVVDEPDEELATRIEIVIGNPGQRSIGRSVFDELDRGRTHRAFVNGPDSIRISGDVASQCES